MCQEQINQRAVEYAQRPLKKNETPFHSEFLLSQANFIYCITRTGFKVFFDCFCMLLSPHLHNIFFMFRDRSKSKGHGALSEAARTSAPLSLLETVRSRRGTMHSQKLLENVLLSRC